MITYFSKKVIFLIITFISVVFIVICHIPTSCKAKRNVNNSLKIEIGMSKKDVLQIMGVPDAKQISFFNTTIQCITMSHHLRHQKAFIYNLILIQIR
jgi:hypothetical protein